MIYPMVGSGKANGGAKVWDAAEGSPWMASLTRRCLGCFFVVGGAKNHGGALASESPRPFIHAIQVLRTQTMSPVIP
jgi:hypothetical protein